MVETEQSMPSAWGGRFGAALGGRTAAPGSCPGRPCSQPSRPPPPGVPPPSLPPGPAAGRTFASEVASGTLGLSWSVYSIRNVTAIKL